MGYEPNELPDCSTPLCIYIIDSKKLSMALCVACLKSVHDPFCLHVTVTCSPFSVRNHIPFCANSGEQVTEEPQAVLSTAKEESGMFMRMRRARFPDFWGPVDPIGIQRGTSLRSE